MTSTPCLAYLLDTPEQAGEVVTYRCTRTKGHAPDGEHEDADAGRSWTSEDDVTWAESAVYPVHDGWPWTDEPAPAPLPALPATPTPVDGATADGPPWARLRADARTLSTPSETTAPAEEPKR